MDWATASAMSRSAQRRPVGVERRSVNLTRTGIRGDEEERAEG
jgi:hypothetical protein